MKNVDIKNFTIEELEGFLQGLGKETYRAKQIFKWIYQKDVNSFEEMTNLSRDFREDLAARTWISTLAPEVVEVSADGTRKFLFRLADGSAIESVLIPDEGRNTLCVSSQVGCAMGCGFCLTGSFGLQRNLSCAEIVNQVCAVRQTAEIRNIVFMGMGEPLANLENVIRAVKILICPDGLQFSNRRVTVSTAGLLPEMALMGKRVTVNLAVSLNATTDAQRDQLMPINRKYPLKALMDACRTFPLPSRRMITFEYVLIKDVNDSLDDAKRFVKLIHEIPSKVNLIPFNEYEGCSFKGPGQDSIDRFHSYLLGKHITVITRSSRGADISAACGQLRGKIEGQKRASRESLDTDLPIDHNLLR
ncbi:MAG: 23S rRNA (adenine(2503)-C(2))-methyltransferase RlmN [Deltaproteobacteria bacterium]|jgi:23S rRNA (adenine2503-C2)-methyltransferase